MAYIKGPACSMIRDSSRVAMTPGCSVVPASGGSADLAAAVGVGAGCVIGPALQGNGEKHAGHDGRQQHAEEEGSELVVHFGGSQNGEQFARERKNDRLAAGRTNAP